MCECIRAYDIRGPLLSLGVPRLDFTWAQLARATALPVPDGDPQAMVRATDFFRACGIDETVCLDISDYEGADVIFDLNCRRLPQELLSRFGCILNGGTLEHVFDLPTALTSITRMLKPGGIVIHHLPVHNWVDHGFYQFSPTLMFDYYSAAKFEILESVGLLFHPSGNEPWEVIPIPPQGFGQGLCGSFGTQAMLCVFVARKTAETLDRTIPMQSLYTTDPVRPPPTLRWFTPFAMKDGIRIERDAYEPIVLGPFIWDSGLAWYAPVPAGLVEDTADAPVQSTLVIFEEGVLLGPPHTDHTTIRRLGGGAYSHWNGRLLFSTSDGSDPNANGRKYVARAPRAAMLAAQAEGHRQSFDRGRYETIDVGPFARDNGLAWCASLPAGLVEDTTEAPTRSPLVLFEDDVLLGPAHTDHATIRRLGGGAYSHWNGGLIFSTTDGSDPNTNGRRYVAYFPRAAARDGSGEDENREASDHDELERGPKSILLDLDPRRMRFDRDHGYVYALPPEIPGGDNEADPFRSWAQLFENEVELGPGHLSHDEINGAGHGGFSHWENQLFFSASDNSSPIRNGRRYRLLVPASMFVPGEIALASTLGIGGYAPGKLPPMERFKLARVLYRRFWPNTPLPDHGRRIDQDTGFTREITRLSPDGDVTHERKYNLDQLFQLVWDVDGDVAECGAYKGGSAFFLARGIAEHGLNKRLFLFDSFEGLSTPEPVDGQYWYAGAMESTIDDIKRALMPLGALPFVEFYKGWIPDRFPEVADRRFCFVHIDVDLYQPTLDSIAFFYPRMVPGGIMLFDDYGFGSCPGATAAIDRFMDGKAEPIINLSAGGAFIVKKADTQR
jgi:hypothetical protein